jgi:membrane protein insertase Oxa1/YidC/SpoIIIJ
MDIDADLLSQVPSLFSFADPYVQKSCDFILQFQQYTGLPWPVVIGLICFSVRTMILPLFLLQTKKISGFALKINLAKEIKRLVDHTRQSKKSRYLSLFRLFRQVNRELKLKPMRLVLYNVIHIPFLIFVIFSVRKAISNPEVKDLPFLWAPNFIEIDPYYIMPLITVGIFYYIFGRGISALNRHTMLGRIRTTCQTLMILWLPILSSWPAPIVYYIMCNAIFSLFQTGILGSPIVLRFIQPKALLGLILFGMQQQQKDFYYQKLNALFKTDPKAIVTEDMVLAKARQEIKRLSQNRN